MSWLTVLGSMFSLRLPIPAPGDRQQTRACRCQVIGLERMSEAPVSRHPDEDSLLRIVLRRVVRSLRREASTPAFGRLLLFQASGAAGDALIALALAGSLFFSVPEAEARGKVALYLLLTVAPFAVVTPLLARMLDRHRGGLRTVMAAAALGRGSLAWALRGHLGSAYLFPIAFGILVLSRAALVVRGATLPHLVPTDRGLVTANASLSKISALAGMVAVLPGFALLRWLGVDAELTLCSLIYVSGVLPVLRLPRAKGMREGGERLVARAAARSMTIRQALVAVGGMRFCTGFLVMHLAFTLRRDLGSGALAMLVVAAASGGLVGAILAPRLRRALREEGILVVSLATAGLAGLVAGRWFSLISATSLVFFFGIAGGASKVAFDSIGQREISEAARGWAFARFESILQLAWVVGAIPPLLLALPEGMGVVIPGAIASSLTVIYMYGRHRVRSARLP